MLSLRRLLPLTAAALACSAAPALAAPVNDDFSAATVLGSSGSQSFATTTVGATAETNEPEHYGQGRSVWYRWTPSATGGVHLAACGAGLQLAVYTGTSVGDLTRRGGGGGKCAGDHVFHATAGQTYRIAVDADTNPAGAAGTVVLKQVTTLPNMALGAPLTKVGRSGEVPIEETTGAEGLYFIECSIPGRPVQDGTCFKRPTGWVFRWQNLPTGTHTLKVAVRDFYFNVDPTPLVHSFTVDADPPETTITSAPPAPTATSATVTFASSEPGSTFACSLNGGSYLPCTTPWTFPVPLMGGNFVHVRAYDAYGNGDVTPAHLTWIRKDPVPTTTYQRPAVTTTSTPPSATTTTTAVRPAVTSSVPPMPCRPVVRVPSSATRSALRRGIRVTIATGTQCSISATLKRGTTTLTRFSGTMRLTRVVRLSRSAVRSLKAGSRLTLGVRARGAAGAVSATARIRVRS